MIIECDQCNTKFRLDDSRISPNGVKVRCTKCQNVFIVTPPPPPEEVQVEEVFGPDTPFMGKVRDDEGAGRPEGAQETGTPELGHEGAPWGVFNTGGKEDSEASAETGSDVEDGRSEAPDLSFGGPDLGSLSGLSGQRPAPIVKETGDDAPREKADGPWFTGDIGDEDDGFPEDGPTDAPASGETPFADGIAPSAGAPVDDGFDVSAPQEAVEGERPPFDEFDFGMDEDGQEEAEEEAGQGADGWGAREEEAPQQRMGDAPDNIEEETRRAAPVDTGDDAKGNAKEAPVEEPGGEFSLTPPPAPSSRPGESAGAEKVIPFSAGYSRNGKTARAASGEENRFEDLFTRTLSEKDAGETVAADEADEADVANENEIDEPEFDRDDLLEESLAAPEDGAGGRHYPGMGLIVAVLIFILGAGAVYYSGIIDTIARTLTASAPSEPVEIETISGYMAANRNFGRFFVIEAKIKNTSDTAQSIEKITGVIYDDRGRSIATRSVSPGRVVTEDDLKSLTKADLLGRFSDSSGGVIPPKGTVPVMVPFTEIPAGMAEYGLKIVRE